ncbi:MAG: hypothetical protein HYV63_31090 [Candidatus Schekmanbacteria bacterium]|nr:hypothetical protein [Candidatus Schekmanbacteria bacterium]
MTFLRSQSAGASSLVVRRRGASAGLVLAMALVLVTPEVGHAARAMRALNAQRPTQDCPTCRPTQPGETSPGHSYDAGAQVFSFASTRFRVFYVTSTTDTVPATDTNENSVPDYVEMVASQAEATYDGIITDLGYPAPLSDTPCADLSPEEAEPKIDIYLLHVEASVSGYAGVECIPDPEYPQRAAGYIGLDNDYQFSVPSTYPDASYPVRAALGMTIFFLVQAAYDYLEDPWWIYSSATWMSDNVADDVNAYFGDLDTFFQRPHYPLGYVGSNAPDIEYGHVTFPMFLVEGHTGQVNVLKKIWEKCGDVAGGNSFSAIDAVLQQELATTLDKELPVWAAWNLIAGEYDDGAHYSDGAAWSQVVTGSHIKLEQILGDDPDEVYPLGGESSSGSHPLTRAGGTTYIVFVSDQGWDSLTLTFDGYERDTTTSARLVRWGATAILDFGENRYEARAVPLDAAWYGTLEIPEWEQVKRVILAGTNLYTGTSYDAGRSWFSFNALQTVRLATPTPTETPPPTATMTPLGPVPLLGGGGALAPLAILLGAVILVRLSRVATGRAIGHLRSAGGRERS